MAEFGPAFELILKNEGFPGWAIDNNGAEVCAGINRAYWPGWTGWDTIDMIKLKVGDDKKAINSVLGKDTTLRAKVSEFYKMHFWTPSLAELKNQELANWLADKYVQCYIPQSNKFLQRALGVNDDGKLGIITLTAANNADPVALLAKCRTEARKFYAELHAKNPAKYPKWMAERA